MTTVELLPGNAILFKRDTTRIVYVPGSDLSEAPERVRIMAETFWTPDVIQSYINTHNPEINDVTS